MGKHGIHHCHRSLVNIARLPSCRRARQNDRANCSPPPSAGSNRCPAPSLVRGGVQCTSRAVATTCLRGPCWVSCLHSSQISADRRSDRRGLLRPSTAGVAPGATGYRHWGRGRATIATLHQHQHLSLSAAEPEPVLEASATGPATLRELSLAPGFGGQRSAQQLH